MELIKRSLFFLVLVILLSYTSCSVSSSFKPGGSGGDIAASSILIPLLDNNAAQGPTSLSIDFTEVLRDYFQSNSKLIVNSDLPSDLELSGTIENLSTRQIQNNIENGTSTQSELTVQISISYVDNNDEEQNLNKSFSQSLPYDADLTLEEATDEFLPEILDLLAQDIFNSTVARW